MGNRESRGKTWNGELDKKKQASWTRTADLGSRGGGQMGGRSQEKEGGMHGAGLEIAGMEAGTGDCGGRGAWGGEKRTQGLGRCPLGKPTNTEEEKDTGEHTRKGAFLHSRAECNKYGTGPTQRSREDEPKP